MLLIGQTQIVAQPLRVFRQIDAKRGEAQQRIRRIVAAVAQQIFEPCGIGRGGDERPEQAGLAEHARDFPGTAGGHELQNLVSDSFPRQLGEAGTFGHGGLQGGRVQRSFRIICGETEEAQDAQIIFADAGCWIADKAQPVRFKIGKPADIIIENAVTRHRQGIHGEVAPPRIAGEIAAELDFRMPPIGLYVFAQAGDLEGLAVDEQRDGAMREPGADGAHACRSGARHDRLGRRRRGYVAFENGAVKEGIAQRAADHARFLAVAVKQGEDAKKAFVLEQSFRRWRRCNGNGAHSICPGTRRPFSIWAGR